MPCLDGSKVSGHGQIPLITQCISTRLKMLKQHLTGLPMLATGKSDQKKTSMHTRARAQVNLWRWTSERLVCARKVWGEGQEFCSGRPRKDQWTKNLECRDGTNLKSYVVNGPVLDPNQCHTVILINESTLKTVQEMITWSNKRI